jgi:LPS-assembly protein
MPARFRRLTLTALLTTLVTAQAAPLPEIEPWGLCATPFVEPPRLPAASGAPSATHIESDTVESHGDGARTYTFLGNGSVQRDGQWLRAERIDYRDDGGEATAQGAVQFGQGDVLLRGELAQVWFNENRARVEQTQFFLPRRHARGDAQRAEFSSRATATLTGTRYTTCNSGDDAWYLHARTLTLDSENNIGTATHVWLDFHGVPFLYFPYLNFPLYGRKSGLLFPTFGRSSRLGTRVAVPFYWNIAPNADATLTLQNLTDRGQQWLGQFRYLQPTYSGEANFEVLPDDKQGGRDRIYTELRHRWAPAARWVNTIDYRHASDGDYFDDFGDRLSSTSVVHLERSARSSYSGDRVRVTGAVLDYQTLDETVLESQRPYRKLPEITLAARGTRAYAGFRPHLDAGLVNFEREDRVSGVRTQVTPSIAHPIEGVSGYLRPKLAARYTAYSLRRTAAGADERPTRATSVFSLDSGVYFDRDLDWFGGRWQQTLEPRAFYLYVPFHDQANQIRDENNVEQVFDAGLNGLNYAQLFSENRFSGGDRDGDANQVALALTSRVLDARGAERLSASLGRLFYFQDREVTLPGAAPQTTPYSNVVGELSARPVGPLSMTATAQYNSEFNAVAESVLQLRYQPQRRKIANLALRLAKDPNSGDFTQHETDLSVFWPVHTHWNVIGRRNYSMRDHRHKEWLAGLEYDSCCWALRLVTRSYVTNLEDPNWGDHPETNRSLMLQLELKGLSNVGQNIQSLLENQEHGIAGY